MMTIKGEFAEITKGEQTDRHPKVGSQMDEDLRNVSERGDDDAGGKFLHLLVF
jgi:hypothetical protein